MGFAAGFAAGLAVGKKKFSGGGGDSDKWVRPADWPVLPDPSDNQIIILTTTQWNISPWESFNVIAKNQDGTSKYFSGGTYVTVDWGDGNIENIELPSDKMSVRIGHYFYNYDTKVWNPGPILKNGAHVFKVTITLPDDVYVSWGDYCDSLDIHIGANILFNNSISSIHTLEHIKFFGWVPNDKNCGFATDGLFSYNQVLQSVETTIPFPIIKSRMFQGCHSLNQIDLSECVEIQNLSFNACYGLNKIISNKLTKIGESAFASCFSLKKFSAPLIETVDQRAFSDCYALEMVETPRLSIVGNYAFNSCYNLSYISHAENWVLGNDPFNSCYKYYDNPGMSHPDLN